MAQTRPMPTDVACPRSVYWCVCELDTLVSNAQCHNWSRCPGQTHVGQGTMYTGAQWASWQMWLNDRCMTAVWPYRHCSHRICSRVYETVRRLSFCPSVPSCTVAVACHRFAAVGSLGRQYRSFTARRICSRSSRLSIHIHSSTLVSNKCEQCHVYSDVASWTQTCIKLLWPLLSLCFCLLLHMFSSSDQEALSAKTQHAPHFALYSSLKALYQTVPPSPRLSPAAVQCDVTRPVTEAETQSIQRHAHEADLQVHMSSLHPGTDAPSADCKHYTVSETAFLYNSRITMWITVTVYSSWHFKNSKLKYYF